MPCRPCLAGSSDAARSWIRCFRAGIGATAGDRWDADAHRALYLYLSRIVNVRSERGGATAEQIAAIPFGSEPETTARYVASFPIRYFSIGATFWTCSGFAREAAQAQHEAGAGPYWDVLTDVTQHVYNTETGTAEAEKDTGVSVPLVVGGLALGGLLLWLLLRD